MSLILFLIQVFVISFSGAMSPGAVSTTAIAMGTRNRFAGLLLGLGHTIIELPVMILIAMGMDKILNSNPAQIIIGFTGGIILILMAVGILTGIKKINEPPKNTVRDKPILAGIILSVSNPYFLIWWATIGLALATTASQLGIWAFILFALVHWLCDCLWLEALSLASFKGAKLLGQKGYKIIMSVCAVAIIVFGLFFLYNASDILSRQF